MDTGQSHINLVERLESHGVRPTAVRLLVLATICSSSHPLSSLEIETLLETVDRSTVTRSLALFSEKGLVHVINDGTGSAKYEACPSPSGHSASDMHVHFHCRKCGKTYCLAGTTIPAVKLPEGYEAEDADYIIAGLCPRCSKTEGA